MKNFRRLLSSAGVWTFVECCDAFEANKSAGSCGEIKEALRILYVHGYGSKINRTGRAIEKLAKQEFGDIRMLYNHYYDEIASVQQIKEIVARIDSDCRKFNPHIVIGSSFGGFLVLHIPGYMRILINPCLLPSEHVGTISPDMPETDLENLKTLEHSCLSNAGNGTETWGLFSNHDEMFGGSGYKDLYESICGQERLRRMDSPHRISETAIREILMPVIGEKIKPGNAGR